LLDAKVTATERLQHLCFPVLGRLRIPTI